MSIRILAAVNKRAEILIHEAIGENWYGDGLTSKRFIKDLEALGDVDTIVVRINSPGGAVFDGIAIFNALKAHKATKEVVVEGLAASAASFIAMVGNTIRMGEGAMMMVHNPWTFAMGDANDMRDVADMLDQVGESLIDIYENRTKLSRDELKQLLDAETWLTAKQAIEKGFADESEQEKEDDDGAKASAARDDHRAKFKEFSQRCQQAANQTTLRIAAELFQSAPADATTEVPEMKTDAASANDADNKTPQQIAAEAGAQALAKERVRQDGIRAAFGRFGADHRQLLDACLTDQTCTVEAAREKLLNKLGEDHAPLAGSSHVQPGTDARDKFVAGAVSALLARAGRGEREIGNEFNGMSLTDLASHALGRVNVSTRGMTKDAIARKVLASHTTSDFPLLLSNTAGKVLRKAYVNAPVTWNRWCKVGAVSDFKAAYRHTLGSFSSLLTKPERGEYKQGTVGEARESITAATKGRYISLSREMLVNDDLGGFMDMSQKMGRAAARTVESDVYTSLTSASGAGPTMNDTGALFNATAITTAGGHANLLTVGTAISVTSIAAGEAAMLAQKDQTGVDFVIVQPRYLLCAPAKKQLAWEVVNSLTDVSQSNSAKRNYVQAQLNLEVLSSPYLSGNRWYLVSDPADCELYEVAFLDGVQEPFIDEEIEFMTDSLNMKVRLDYGLAPIDFRAGYNNAGA